MLVCQSCVYVCVLIILHLGIHLNCEVSLLLQFQITSPHSLDAYNAPSRQREVIRAPGPFHSFHLSGANLIDFKLLFKWMEVVHAGFPVWSRKAACCTPGKLREWGQGAFTHLPSPHALHPWGDAHVHAQGSMGGLTGVILTPVPPRARTAKCPPCPKNVTSGFWWNLEVTA